MLYSSPIKNEINFFWGGLKLRQGGLKLRPYTVMLLFIFGSPENKVFGAKKNLTYRGTKNKQEHYDNLDRSFT